MKPVMIPLCIVLLLSSSAKAAPPFSGTIFIDPDIITPEDPTTFVSIQPTGNDSRVMYDRRTQGWITVEPHLFEAAFDDNLTIEMQVNPEFSYDSALQLVQRFAPVIGRLPTALRMQVQTSWIHDGVASFGGGNNNLLIHTGQAALYEKDGILEETFVHEAAHTSLDPDHARSSGWIDAQGADNEFISTYARDNSTTEDIAESFLPYLAVRYRPDRISPELKETIENTIPNRISYFNSLDLDMYPISDPTTITRSLNRAQGISIAPPVCSVRRLYTGSGIDLFVNDRSGFRAARFNLMGKVTGKPPVTRLRR